MVNQNGWDTLGCTIHFFYTRKCKFGKKQLSKVGWHGNVSVDVLVIKTLNCSQIN